MCEIIDRIAEKRAADVSQEKDIIIREKDIIIREKDAYIRKQVESTLIKLVTILDLSIDEAMDFLDIPQEERMNYRSSIIYN